MAKKNILRFLAGFQCRFNQRYELESLVPRLAAIAIQKTVMSDRLLTLAGKEWSSF